MDVMSSLEDKRDTLLREVNIRRDALNTRIINHYRAAVEANDEVEAHNEALRLTSKKWFIRGLWLLGLGACLAGVSLALAWGWGR